MNHTWRINKITVGNVREVQKTNGMQEKDETIGTREKKKRVKTQK